MIVEVPHVRYLNFKHTKQHFREAHLEMWPKLWRAIMRSSQGLGVYKNALLMFILAMTYARGRQGAQIYRYQFEKGAVKNDTGEVLCAGTGITKAALSKHMSELSEAGLVVIYRSLNEVNGAENEPRIFEIDCKKVLEIGGKNSSLPPAEFFPHQLGKQSIAKAIVVNPADGGTSLTDDSEEKVTVLKAPKKGYWQPPAQNESAPTAVVAQIKSLATIRQTTRIATAQSKAACDLSKDEMQAVIDRNMAMYQPRAPRMLVTLREHGFFRKRLKEASPGDFDQFIRWALTYWADLATQNRKALKKREEAGERNLSPLPMSPDFHTLVYRYPYLLKAYGNFNAERCDTAKPEAGDKKVNAMEAEIERLRQEGQTLRKALRSRTVATPPLKTKILRATPARFNDSDELPAWEDPVGKTNAKRA